MKFLRDVRLNIFKVKVITSGDRSGRAVETVSKEGSQRLGQNVAESALHVM